MKISSICLVATAIAFAAAAGGCGWLIAVYAPGASPVDLFLQTDVLSGMVNWLNLLLIVTAVVVGLAARGEGARNILALVAIATGLLGLLAALLGWSMTQAAIRATNTTSFEVVAPSHAGTLMTLAIGLFGALVAQLLRARLVR